MPQLRALEPDDRPALQALVRRPEVLHHLDLAPDDAERWLQPGSGKLALGAFEDGILVAAASLAVFERLRQRHTASLVVAADPARIDAGAALLGALVEVGDRWWHLDRIELVLAADAPWISASEQAGFAREVLRRSDWARDGAFVDTASLAWIRPGMTSPPRAPPSFPRGPRGPLPESFTLRPISPSDAPAMVRVMGDPSVRWGTLQVPFTAVATWRARLESNRPGRDFSFVATVDGEVVGSIGLHGTPSPRRDHVWMMGMSVEGAWQGRGLGDVMMRHLLQTADGIGAKRVELDVYVDNTRAIALYEKLGFVREGIKRLEAWRDGAYVDALVMARLR